jgi:NTE family protein
LKEGTVLPTQVLARAPLFDGLGDSELEAIVRRLPRRHFKAGDEIWRQGEAGSSLLIIIDGLADVLVTDPGSGQVATMARLRRGDVVGEMSLITGEPRSASVVAAVPTEALEVDQDHFAAIVGRHPAVLTNLNRILSGRLMRTNLRQAGAGRRGEALALVYGPSADALVPEALAFAQASNPRTMALVDSPSSVEACLARLDDLLSDHGLVVVSVRSDSDGLPLLAAHMDRVVCVGDRAELDSARDRLGSSLERGPRPENVVLDGLDSPPVGDTAGASPIRALDARDASWPARRTQAVAWLGRHLARTKIGLALGAGGARGYAHIGALYALHEAGYEVDFAAGSSIGAVVGAWLALGAKPDAIDAMMRQAFSQDNVAAMFKLSLAGTSTGLEVMRRVFEESTGRRSFGDLLIPLLVMTVDLNTRMPAAIREGRLSEALLAATALAGMFPPYVRGDQRLVDGLALVPVPSGGVRDLGADIVVSVNIMSRESLVAWPGEPVPEPEEKRAGSRMLDTLLEVMDLGQLDSSVRHAGLADVVITPRFGPSSWRDFHLADRFLEAGRHAAQEQLSALGELAKPQAANLRQGELYGAAVHV